MINEACAHILASLSSNTLPPYILQATHRVLIHVIPVVGERGEGLQAACQSGRLRVPL